MEKPSAADGADGEAVNQQCARVVQQALAFEDRQDAMRRPQLAEHRGCGDGVGRRDDGAQRNRRRPRHRRHERARDDGDGDGRESDREDDQPRDRRPVVLEVSQRRVVCRVEQYGRDEQRQRKIGRKGERGRGRKKGEQCAAERQEHRIRCADAARCRRQNHGGDEQREKLFELMHGQPRLWPRLPSAPRTRTFVIAQSGCAVNVRSVAAASVRDSEPRGLHGCSPAKTGAR